MAPEYGATCGFFPIDKETIDYLNITGRDKKLIKIVETMQKNKRYGEMVVKKLITIKV